MSINRYYLPNPVISGLTSFLAGFGTQRQAVHAQEAGQEAQQQQRLYEGIGQGIGGGVAAYANRSAQLQDQQTQHGFRLGEIGAQGANAIAVQNARRQLPPGFEQDVASIYGFGPSAMPNDGGAGQSMGVPPPLQVPGGMSQQPGPSDAGFFSPSDPGAAPSTPGFVAQPADTKASREAWANVDETRAAVQRALQRDMPAYERDAVISAGRRAIQQAEMNAQQYPRPQGPPRTAQEVFQSGAAIPIPGTSNFFLPDKTTGGYKVSAAVHPDETTAPYGPTATPEMLQAYARARVIDNPDGSKTKIQPDGKVDIEWAPSGGKTGQVEWDPVEETHAARKELAGELKDKQPTGPTDEQVKARVESNRKIAEDQAAQGLTAYPIDKLLSNAAYIIQNDVTDQYGSVRPQKAQELLAEFQRAYPRGVSSIPKDDPRREEIIRAVLGLSTLSREQAPVTLP